MKLNLQVVGSLGGLKLLVNLLIVELAILELEQSETDGGLEEDEHGERASCCWERDGEERAGRCR